MLREGGGGGGSPALIAYVAEGAGARLWRHYSSNSCLTRGQCALEDARESQRTPHASSPATLETPSPSFSHSMSPASSTLADEGTYVRLQRYELGGEGPLTSGSAVIQEKGWGGYPALAKNLAEGSLACLRRLSKGEHGPAESIICVAAAVSATVKCKGSKDILTRSRSRPTPHQSRWRG